MRLQPCNKLVPSTNHTPPYKAMAESCEVADTTTPLPHSIAKSLLRPWHLSVFDVADNKYMWSRRWTSACRTQWSGSVLDRLWDSLLLRTYDILSGSQPDGQHRMLARDAKMRLDSNEACFDTLTKYANHGIWKHTPYISFTNSPNALQDLAESRMRKRGEQSLVVVDPRVRIEMAYQFCITTKRRKTTHSKAHTCATILP